MRLATTSVPLLRIKITRLVSTLLRFESYDNLLRLATTLIQYWELGKCAPSLLCYALRVMIFGLVSTLI